MPTIENEHFNVKIDDLPSISNKTAEFKDKYVDQFKNAQKPDTPPATPESDATDRTSKTNAKEAANFGDTSVKATRRHEESAPNNKSSIQSSTHTASKPQPKASSNDDIISIKKGIDSNNQPVSPFAGRTFGASNSKTFAKQGTGDAVAEHKAKSQE